MPSIADLLSSLIRPQVPPPHGQLAGPQSATRPGAPNPLDPSRVPAPGYRTPTGAFPEPQGQGGPGSGYNIPLRR